jgi:starvation-inducible DNA-binding protein
MNYLGIKQVSILDTAEELNNLLSNYQIYYQNLRNFHWNISGQHFFDLHEKFESLYNDAKLSIDEIAERILTLRLKPASTLSTYLERSEIKEHVTTDSNEMVRVVLENHRILIENMRRVINLASEKGDEGTVDMISSFLSNIEKKSWMLDAWLASS